MNTRVWTHAHNLDTKARTTTHDFTQAQAQVCIKDMLLGRTTRSIAKPLAMENPLHSKSPSHIFLAWHVLAESTHE
jgi:hypothetical protein